MAKTATSKASDAFLGLEIEKILPNKLLRNAVFFVVVIWGVAIALAALAFNIYLLTPEEWALLSPARLKVILSFLAFSADAVLCAFIFMLGCWFGVTRTQKRKTKSTENFSRSFS